MKKLIIIFFSLFIITGCGDDSSGKKTTTRNGNRVGGFNGSYNNGSSGCGSLGCGSNSGNPVAGNSTSTPFSIGKTSGFSDDIRLGLEFYADSPSSVEALGQMEVNSTSNFGSNYCRIPNGLYELETISRGSVGTNGQVNANHEYSGMTLEGYDNSISFRIYVHHALSVNFGDDWGLGAHIQLLSVDGHDCSRYGAITYSFSFSN